MDEKWFHKQLSRQKAEDLLQNAGIDGSFLVRSSESILGAYALSILFNKTVHTYRVLPTDTGLLGVQTLNGVQQRKFKTIQDLVHEYRNPQNGLVCALINPVGLSTPAPKLPHYEPPSVPIRSDPPPLPPVATHPPTRGGVKVIPVETHKLPQSIQNSGLPPVPPQSRPLAARLSHPESPKNPEAETQAKFVARLQDIKSHFPNVNPAYFESVQLYASERGLLDDLASVKRGESQCAQLQTLLAKEAVAFQCELEKFLTKIDVLRQLFDFSSPARRGNPYKRSDEDVDLDTFLNRLGDCQAVVKSLNRKACNKLQEMSGTNNNNKSMLPRKMSRSIPPLTERIFEVKQEGALKYAKQKLKLEVLTGKLHAIKSDGTSTEYDHSQVLQIIKNNKSKTKLSIVFKGNKKREYSFDQSAQREAFCQLLQHIRNKHSESSDPDCVSIFVGTWNMGDAIPPGDISSWFLCRGTGKCLDESVNSIPHDIYVIGTQETGPPEKEWLHRCMDTVQEITGKTFHMVSMDALWHIKILVFVKEEHKNRISHVKTSSVKTGIANALGNKGAVGVSFQFGGTSFCFINAHLTSGAEKCIRRNNNYVDIMRSLNLGEDRFRDFDLCNRFDHLYFIGDLNYRLEMDIQEILLHLQKTDYHALYTVDQLRREKDSNKVFTGFCEEEVLFPPTYRYERGTRDSYAHLKVKKTGIRINNPSWCDRVLWRSYPETHSMCLSYGCCDDIMTSDHSPVFANYQVGVRGQYVSNAGLRSSSDIQSENSFISFENVEVILKAPGKSGFYLQFHSVCLIRYVRSKRNTRFDTSDLGPNYVRLGWNKESIDQLKPIIADREYLVDQHILVSVRAEDDHEVHAECVLALRSMIGTDPQKFEERISRKGEETGQIRGRMWVKPRSSGTVKEKTYDFIQFGGVKEDDGKKSHIVEEAYSVVSEPLGARNQLPVNQIQFRLPAVIHNEVKSTPKMSPEVAIYSGEPDIEEDAYANPDDITGITPISMTSQGPPPPSPPAMMPHQSNPNLGGSPTFPALNDRRFITSSNQSIVGVYGHAEVARPKVKGPDLDPPSRPAPVPNRPHLIRGQSSATSSAPSSRPSTPVTSSNPASRNATPVTSPVPHQHLSAGKPHYRPSVATKKRMVDDALAEFEDCEGIFRELEAGPVTHRQPGSDSPRPKSALHFPNQSPPRIADRRSFEGKSPTTVSDFLSILNLEHYTPLLHENGWDSIEFLGDITEADLHDAGITNQIHCRLILHQIQTLSL